MCFIDHLRNLVELITNLFPAKKETDVMQNAFKALLPQKQSCSDASNQDNQGTIRMYTF